jgi:trehalose-phosphatase
VPAELRQALLNAARQPRLLLASDYDGTLAPIVADPDKAKPLPEAVRALRALAELPDTTAAVISGRSLHDLATLSRLPAEIHLVGSHGSEFDVGLVYALSEDARGLLDQLRTELQSLTSIAPGSWLELKPASVAVHLRRAEQLRAKRLVAAVRSGPANWDGVWMTEGKAIVELAVIPTDKGAALERLRHQVGATAAVVVGDDVTDESAFARLTGPDVAIRVGDGETIADHRVADPASVAALLAFLVEERQAWLFGESAVPIERLTMLANETAVALLTPDARVCWMCHPTPDSAAIFADLVGGRGAGHFSIHPAHAGLPLSQRYLPGTMTVQTRWPQLVVTDYLATGLPRHRTDLVRVLSGSAVVELTFAPRPEFGQAQILLEPWDGGLRVIGTSTPMVLVSPGITWDITTDGRQETAHALVELRPDQAIVLELRCGSGDLRPARVRESVRRTATNDYWLSWLNTLSLPTVVPDLVARSALTLRGLCHAESGGIMAAATTSLPEALGGVRNWDYRYCWLRDGAMTAETLVNLGSTVEAEAYLRWLHTVLANVPGPEYLHPLYTLSGAPLGPEAVIESLSGYAGSRPVRVGNLANQQVQLDIFGPVTELILALSTARGSLSDDDWLMVLAMTTAVAARWQEADHGIWEDRSTPQHHVYSKVMCWVTVDRAVRMAAAFDRDPDPAWTGLRDEIAQEVLDCGWDPDACGGIGAYTVAYGHPELDAASLHVGLSGLLEPSDPRFAATVAAVEAGLRSGATVYRYRRDDGLPGVEGGFHLCTAWLIEAYLLVGQRAEAEDLFAQFLEKAGPTGLLPEEYDPVTERSLGNHPQAYSHIGLIRCAQLLDRVESRAEHNGTVARAEPDW